MLWSIILAIIIACICPFSMDFFINYHYFYQSKLDDDLMVELLIEFEADINLPNQLGQTPLHLAAMNGEYAQ